MTEELKQAAQQALEALSLALSDVDWRADSPTQPVIHKAHNLLQRALTAAQPAQAGEVDERIAELEAERDKWKSAEHALSNSYVRVRAAIGAICPPSLETAELWAYVEATALALTTERDTLRAEVESLRVDAERYEWLRAAHWSDATLCCVLEPKANVRLGATCPSGDQLDTAIDTARKATQ